MLHINKKITSRSFYFSQSIHDECFVLISSIHLSQTIVNHKRFFFFFSLMHGKWKKTSSTLWSAIFIGEIRHFVFSERLLNVWKAPTTSFFSSPSARQIEQIASFSPTYGFIYNDYKAVAFISIPPQVKIWFQNRRMKWRNSKERELIAQGGCREQTLPTKHNPNPDLSDPQSLENRTGEKISYKVNSAS